MSNHLSGKMPNNTQIDYSLAPIIDHLHRDHLPTLAVKSVKGANYRKRIGERREKLAPLNKHATIRFYSPLHFSRCAKRKEVLRDPHPSVVTFARKSVVMFRSICFFSFFQLRYKNRPGKRTWVFRRTKKNLKVGTPNYNTRPQEDEGH